jgi:hypothetical protein
MEPSVHIAYAPRGAGVLCATFWLEQRKDVFGWFTGAKAHEHPAAFFMLGGFHSAADPTCYRSAESDVYGSWLVMSQAGERPIDPPSPLPDAVGHELERLQDAFVTEWLIYDDPAADRSEIERLHDLGLPVLDLNIRPSKISKLRTDAAVWTYSSPGADLNGMRFLAARWPLDYRPE